MKNKNWVWGLFFLMAGIAVIASQMGSFVDIGVLSIISTVLLAALIIYSLVNLNYFGVFVPMAFLYMIYTEPLGLKAISPWLLIFTSLLLSVGFSLIFRKRYKMLHSCVVGENFSETKENIDDNNPYTKISFGSSSKYLHSDNLTSGHFAVSFGALEVFFDQAQLNPEGAEIYLDCSFGAIVLHIPRHWQVQDNLHVSLGGVENNNRYAQPSEDSPRLKLTGNVSLSGIEIKYI